jgi:pimeloyl-ACP methyl ester carboxylesterase
MLTMQMMQQTRINGTNFELFDSGAGDPVMFIHGGGSPECDAILQEPALNGSFRLIHFHRRGYGKSDPADPSSTLAHGAADCRSILEQLGIEKAHLVAESSGGAILLQFALNYPDAIQSLALLEPALLSEIGDTPELAATLERAESLYEEGDRAGAVDAFMQEVAGADYRTRFDQNLPTGWFERLANDADTMFQIEAHQLQSWTFTAEDAARITQPVLNMMGEETRPYFRKCHNLIREWIPHAENVVLPNATHCILETNPSGAAEELASFFMRHSN